MLARFTLNCIAISTITLLASCTTTSIKDGAPGRFINVSNIPNPIPRSLPKSRYGNPNFYTIKNKRYYVLKSAKNYDRTGIASWYGTKFHGRLTSTREPYDMYKMTAASPELPIPCYVYVTNLQNNQRIIVKVNDRGPFAKNRIIDLSYVAAKKLGIIEKGTGLVRVTSITSPSTPPHLNDPHIYVQLGAFSNHYNAASLKDEIKYISSEKVNVTFNKMDKLYRVFIGPVKTVKESDTIIENISARFKALSPFAIIK